MPSASALAGTMTTSQLSSQSRLVRDVGVDGMLLQPDLAPLLTILSGLKKVAPTNKVNIEWLEKDYPDFWMVNSNNTYDNAYNTVSIVLGGLYHIARPGCVIAVPQAPGSFSAAQELMLVTAVAHAAATTLTVYRGTNGGDGFAGTTRASIPANCGLRIVGTAYPESAAGPDAITVVPTSKITYPQIFAAATEISGTANEVATYNENGNDERLVNQSDIIADVKRQMNDSFFWGKASVNLSNTQINTGPLRTTMGLNTVISTNRVLLSDGVLTRTGFETYARTAHRYNTENKPLLLIAPPMLVSAIHMWAQSHLEVRTGETMFGVRISRILSGHGEFIMVRDQQLGDGISGQNNYGHVAFAVDVDQLSYMPLGKRDLQLFEGVQLPNYDKLYDIVRAEVAFKVKHEKRHSILANIQSYVA